MTARARAERSREMHRLYYEEDLTLQEIGDRFGVTRERVRQLLAEVSGNGQPSRVERISPRFARRAAEATEAEADYILRRFREGAERPTITRELRARGVGATYKSVTALLRARVSALEWKQIHAARIAPAYHRTSEDDLLANLRLAVRDMGQDFGHVQFAEWAKARGVPGPQTYIHRFGSWAEARARVGLKTKRRLGHRRRSDRVSEEKCIAAIREVVAALDHLPSAREYQVAARERGLPSVSTVRNRLGDGHWAEALARVDEGAGRYETSIRGRHDG